MSSEMFKSLRHLFLGWDREEPFEAEQKPQFGPLTCWPTIEVHYMEKNPGMFSSKTLNYLIFHWIKKNKNTNILDDMGHFYLFILRIFILEVNLAQIVDHQDGSSTWSQS